MTFKTSLDKTAQVITIGVAILFAAIIFGQYKIITDQENSTPIYTTAACVLIYGICYAFRTVNYVLTNEELIIERPIKNVWIKRSDIKSVELIDNKIIRRSIRTFGNGGLFGYYGKFANFKMGSMTWYATRRDRTVLVTTTGNKKIILTPDEPEQFVASFNM